jgi:hypothetical protein
MTAIGTNRTKAMSGVRSLAGVNRTWRRDPNSVENDPKLTLCSIVVMSASWGVQAEARRRAWVCK